MLRGFGRPSAVPAPAPTSAPTPSASSGSGPWRRSAEAPQSAAPAEQSQRYSPRALERAPPQARAHFSFAPEAAGPRSARPRPGPLSLEAALGCLLPSAEASPPASARGPRPGDPGGGSRTSPSGARFDGRSLDFAALCSRVIVMQRPWTLRLCVCAYSRSVVTVFELGPRSRVPLARRSGGARAPPRVARRSSAARAPLA